MLFLVQKQPINLSQKCKNKILLYIKIDNQHLRKVFVSQKCQFIF